MLTNRENLNKPLTIRDVLPDARKIHMPLLLTENSVVVEEIKKALILINSVYDLSSELIPAKNDSTITLQIEKFLNWISNKGIRIPHSNDIRNYLLQHYDMLNFLPLVCKKAIEQFGPPYQVSLEVYSDPEIPDESLTLYVRAPSYDENFIQILDNLFPEYQSYLSESTGWFIVTTDFRHPM